MSVALTYLAIPKYRATENPGVCCSVNALIPMKKAIRLTALGTVG